MRLFVRRDIRRPHPEPAATNDALAFAVGLGGWVLGLAVLLGMLASGSITAEPHTLATVGVGIVLGLLGLLVSWRRGRGPRSTS